MRRRWHAWLKPAVQLALMRTHTPSRLPLDADAPLRITINGYATRLAAIIALLFFSAVAVALLLGVIAGVSGTTALNGPLTIASGLFCFSLPILIVAAVIAHFTTPRQFRYADRRLATTITALLAGDEDAREQLFGWANDHPVRVRDALRKAYHPDMLPLLVPLVQAANPTRRQIAFTLLDLEQAAVLPALLPYLEGRRRASYLKQRMREQRNYEAAFITEYVLEPLRRWPGPALPPPSANLLRALLLSWPILASDEDVARALTMPDFSSEVAWLNGFGERETRRRPQSFVAVREAAAQVARRRGL